jgi:two-component system, NtrC family, nitrogen regulation sensor histidine kinase GlnL
MTPATVSSLWASLPLPALIIDETGRISDVSPSAETFLNMSQRALVGQMLLDRLIIDAPMESALARVRAHQSPLVIAEADVTTGERAPQTCALHLAPMQDRAGAVLMMMAPREIADRLGRAMQVTSAARSAIGMAEMLAHEIKNPLAGISGAAQLLAMNLTADDLELTDLIVEETRRIVKLLEQVEQFGNLRPPARRAVNLHDALDRARRSALVGFGAKMRIIEDYDPSLPATFADPDQLMQVFLNLLKNASEAAGKDGGVIRLHTFYDRALRRRNKDGSNAALPLQIEVIDDGPGIPPDIAAEIFEPFVSGRENGTGLGLALVSKIITDHEGWISVDSHPGRTVFRLSLPMAPPNHPDQESI